MAPQDFGLFTGQLKHAFQKKDLEAAILREMESFVLELGKGFAFVARQKRLQIGGRDYWIDLKLDRFKPEFKGQMELHLRWLDKHGREAGGLGLWAYTRLGPSTLKAGGQSGYSLISTPTSSSPTRKRRATGSGRRRRK